MLSADFANLGHEIEKLEKSGADMIHFDIMDGHFVPNLTFGHQMVQALRPKSKLLFDVHLMVSNPEEHIEKFINAGSDYITVHTEATVHLHRLIKQIKATGKKAGVSVVPSTDENILKYIISELDLILVMTVDPGFGGQQFIESQLIKIKNIRKIIDQENHKILLSVDGGINASTAKACHAAGADILVSGSYIFEKDDYASQIRSLRPFTA